MKKTTLGTLAIIACNTIFGFSFLFSKLALQVASPLVLNAARFLTAFLTLNILLLTGKIKLSLSGKPIHKLLLLGFIQPVLYFILESRAISISTVTFSGLIIGLSPVIGLVLGTVFLKERCTWFQAVCTILSVVGVAMTGTDGFGTVSMLGFVLLLATAVCAAVFPIVSRSIAPLFSAYERTYVMIGMGCVIFPIMALLKHRQDLHALTAPLSSGIFWIAVVYLAVVSSVGAFLLLNYSLNHIPAARTLIFSNFTTVISVLVGILILGDRFSLLQFIGIVVITLSVFGVSYQKPEVQRQ